MTTRVAEVTRQLAAQGIIHPRTVFLDLPAPLLVEEAVRRDEGRLARGGSLVVRTGVYTGRSARDKFLVDEPASRDHIDWGEINRPLSETAYERLRNRLTAYLQNREIFVQDCFVGADPAFQRRVRAVTTQAWHSLFARNLFIHPRTVNAPVVEPDFLLIAAPDFKAVPELDGTRSEAFIIVHLGRREILIGGTAYAGEIKKAIFSSMNYFLPLSGVLPMHCSANMGPIGDVAIFFGLSGTGKTTLSTDPYRAMIGDDEHGWSDSGVFNFEGGCYAKVIRLSPKAEPEIWRCTRTFGTVLENVVMDPESRRVDLDSEVFTENTRAGYPLSHLINTREDGMGGHPEQVIMLTADAFGILPPVARLSNDQAMYHFLSGYTAKLAGTERGLTAPQATFSTCFGAPFMVHHPAVYADLLGRKLAQTGARCWLVNTGWTGGPPGQGHRMPILETRAIINAILAGSLNHTPTRRDELFGLDVPLAVDGVAPERLNPRLTWPDAEAHDRQARLLAERFAANFQPFLARVSPAVAACNPAVT